MVIDTMEGTPVLKHKNGKSTIYILYTGDFPVFSIATFDYQRV